MAIAEHAAAPVTNPTTGTGATTPLTTGTFSPPAGSLVIAMCAIGFGAATGNIIVTDSSGGGAWAKVQHASTDSERGVATVAYKYFAAAPGSITVSAALTNVSGGRFIQIQTLTGVHPTAPVGGTKAKHETITTDHTTTITTTVIGSYVAGVGDCSLQSTSATYTAAANSTKLGSFWAGATDDCGMAAFKQTALTTGPGSIRLGFTTSVSSPGPLAMIEFLPATAPPPSATPEITYQALIDWSGDGTFVGTGEDVTDRVLTRSPVTIAYGRDQSRAGTPVRPGVAAFELNNISRDYSPENASSPLVGLVGPGREVNLKATAFGTTYTVYRGFIDDYELLSAIEDKSVQVTAIDTLGSLAQKDISTQLYQGIRTGTAIGLILDAVGWDPAKRDIDLGGTLLQFWWEEGTNAAEAVEKVLDCEGITSTVFVDVNGNFTFRDRHSRLTRTGSATSQATFRAAETDADPVMSPPFTYNGGWRDIINSITYSIDARAVRDLETVWTSDLTYSLATAESVVIRVESSDPFLGAVVPVPFDPVTGLGDYDLLSGTVSMSLSRTSGQTTEITVTATGGAPATVAFLSLRAQPAGVVGTTKVTLSDATSITRYGIQSTTLDMPFAGSYDASAVAAVMLGHRAQRLPIISFRIISKTSGRIVHQLGRDLLDRITVIEPEIGINADFWIEQIQHQFTAVVHETTFGCEKIPAPGAGVNDPADVFIFDGATGHRFNEGKFAW